MDRITAYARSKESGRRISVMVRLDEAHYRTMQRLAQAGDRTIPAEVRRAVRRYLDAVPADGVDEIGGHP